MRLRARGDGDAEDDAAVIADSVRAPERFAAVFDRHAATIHRYLARRLGPAAADDLVGETFLIAFRKRAGFDSRQRDALPWLYGIATNLVSQHRRGEARADRLRHVIPPLADESCHADRVVTEVTARAAVGLMAGALAELNAADRDVLMLVAQEELTYMQVAAALDIPVGTVRSRLHRARVTLRATFGGIDPTRIHEEAICHG